MAAALESSFKDRFRIHLLAFPKTSINSGSFVADFRLQLESSEELERLSQWQPSDADLRALSQTGQTIAATGKPFEYMETSTDEATRLMQDPLRMSCVAGEASSGSLVNYRLGDYVQVCIPSLTHF